MPVVSVDVVVTDNNGNYLKGLKKENFRITEDGTVQTITNFAPSEAPITIVLLLEFSKLGYRIFYLQRRELGRGLSGTISSRMTGSRWRRSTCAPTSTWISRTIATKSCRDCPPFTFPPFSESNLFDALSDVLDRIKDVKGKKAVLVLASGIDTFSRMTLDQTLKRIRETDATIFTVGVGEQFFINQAPGAFGATVDLHSGAKPTQDLCGDDGRPLVAPAL